MKRNLSPILPLLILALVTSLAGCIRSSAPSSSTELAVQGLYSAAISDNAQFALFGSINHGGGLWEIAQNQRLYNWNHKSGDFSQITTVDFDPASDLAITASPLTMVLWDRNTGEGLSYWNAPAEILDASLLPGGRYAALAMVDHTASLYDVQNGGVQRVYNHQGRVNSVDAHLPTNRLLTGSDDFSAVLWNLDSTAVIHTWQMEEEVQLVRLSPDGRIAFVMAKYASATLFDTTTGLAIGEIPLGRSALRRGSELTSVAFSEDSQYLLTGTANRVIQLWQVSDMSLVARWKTPRRNKVSPTPAVVLALAFASDSEYYAVTSDGFIHSLN